MHRLLPLCFALCALLALPFIASNTSAQDTQSKPLDAVLSAVDTVPTRAQLDASLSQPERALIGAANDPNRSTHHRKRAISLLSLYPTKTTSVALRKLAQNPQPELRSIALYTFVRTFANLSPEHGQRAVSIVVPYMRDPDPKVRSYAVRSLRWVDHPSAEHILTSIPKGPFDAELIELAKVTQQRRTKRLKANSSAP